jgi:RNA polymerase sigma-70 factor, ECF subfamily
LVAAVVRGEHRAVDRFVRRCSPWVYSVVREGFRLDHDTADDLFQKVFLKLARDDFHALRNFRGDCTLKTWLTTICRHLAIDHVRAASRDRDSLVRLDDDGSSEAIDVSRSGDPVGVAHASHLRERIADLLAFLPDEYRKVIELYYQEDLDYQEIAGITGMSINHVGVKLNRARGMLRDLVATHCPGLRLDADDE